VHKPTFQVPTCLTGAVACAGGKEFAVSEYHGGQLLPFHVAHYFNGHGPTNFSRWAVEDKYYGLKYRSVRIWDMRGAQLCKLHHRVCAGLCGRRRPSWAHLQVCSCLQHGLCLPAPLLAANAAVHCIKFDGAVVPPWPWAQSNISIEGEEAGPMLAHLDAGGGSSCSLLCSQSCTMRAGI
jgi:hypothetical protein